MMNQLGPSIYVIESCKRLGISYVPLDVLARTNLRSKIEKTYLVNGTGRVWERLRRSQSIQDVDGWRRVDQFIQGNSFVLFFNELDDDSMFYFQAGTKLAPILEDAPGFEFYVTDVNTSYLVCFNHHDYLIIADTGKE